MGTAVIRRKNLSIIVVTALLSIFDWFRRRDYAQVPFSMINTKDPDLPVTGDDGVWKYGVYGILLMTAAGAAIILAMKSKKAPKRKQ